jgi:chorismate mutase
MPNPPSEIEAFRKAIDDVDHRILELVAERMRVVLAVGDYKREHDLAVYDPERERDMLSRLAAAAPSPLDGETVRRIFERLIDESRRLEQRRVQGGSG